MVSCWTPSLLPKIRTSEIFFGVFSHQILHLMCFKSAFLKDICHFLWNTDVLNLFCMNISMKMWTNGSISGHLTTKLHFWHQKRLLQNLGHFGFHPLPPDQNVLILNYKKLGFQVDPLPPFRPMSLNILFFFIDPFPYSSLDKNDILIIYAFYCSLWKNWN